MSRVLPDLQAAALALEAAALARPRGRRAGVTVEEVRRCRDDGLTKGDAATRLDCSLGTITKLSLRGGIKFPRGRRHGRPVTRATASSRFASRAFADMPTRGMPAVTNPAITEARTLYPGQRRLAGDVARVLIDGHNNWKIGARVRKGRWRGMPIRTLTLEERASCPESCRHWRSCYGNQMRFARRLVHGPGLEDAIERDLRMLQARFPDGFVVRLHVLGDFYSAAYVELWRAWLDRFPALRVFGFSARWERHDPIARALVQLVIDRWDRFAVRFSNAPVDECATVSIEHPGHRPADAIICPQQTGQTESCATCGLCWTTRRRIAFLQH